MQKHKILIIPGLSDDISFVNFISYGLNSPEFDVEVIAFGWRKSNVIFKNRVEELVTI